MARTKKKDNDFESEREQSPDYGENQVAGFDMVN